MEKNQNKRKALQQKIQSLLAVNQSSQTDPQGSYTGKPADPNEKPVQDADDL